MLLVIFTNFASFFQLIQHDHKRRSLFVNHLPKLIEGVVQWIIGCYVSVLLLITLNNIMMNILVDQWFWNTQAIFVLSIQSYKTYIDKRCVDVIRFGWTRWQSDPGKVSWKKNTVTLYTTCMSLHNIENIQNSPGRISNVRFLRLLLFKVAVLHSSFVKTGEKFLRRWKKDF
jgi:hypothetical protein